MAAYIVGIIAGTICLVAPLIYAMNVNECVAKIMSRTPDFDPGNFVAYASQGLLYAITIVGAVVLLLSTGMAAFAGVSELKEKRRKLQQAESVPTPSAEQTPPAL